MLATATRDRRFHTQNRAILCFCVAGSVGIIFLSDMATRDLATCRGDMATPCRHQIARFAVANRVSRRKIGLCRQGIKHGFPLML